MYACGNIGFSILHQKEEHQSRRDESVIFVILKWEEALERDDYNKQQ